MASMAPPAFAPSGRWACPSTSSSRSSRRGASCDARRGAGGHSCSVGVFHKARSLLSFALALAPSLPLTSR
eukprot:scaffold112381_cov48-Phaeocystis_antarctica.AAC.2